MLCTYHVQTSVLDKNGSNLENNIDKASHLGVLGHKNNRHPEIMTLIHFCTYDMNKVWV